MTLFRLATAGLLLAPLFSLTATAQLLDPGFTPPSGVYAPAPVNVVGPQQADGKRLISGLFSRVNGTASGRLVRLDAAGALDAAFSQAVGPADNVYRIKSLPNGQYLLGAYGGSITIGTTTRVELLRLNPNGTPDNTFDCGSGPSTSAAGGYSYVQTYAVQPDGKVVVAGYFDTFSGTLAQGVVRLNANGTIDNSFTTGTGFLDKSNSYAQPYGVAIQPDGKILLVGDFVVFNGMAVPGIVRLNANGGLDATYQPAIQAGSYAEGVVMQPDGKALVNGYLEVNGLSNPPGVVRLLLSGALDTGFNPSPTTLPTGSISTSLYDDAVQLQANGQMVVAGYFSGGASNYIARLNTDGSLDNSFHAIPGPSMAPYTFSLNATGEVVVGGAFNNVSGLETTLARLSNTGALDPAFAPKMQTLGNVTAVARQADGKLVVGGNFTEINGQAVHRLVRLADDGTLDANYAAAVGSLPAPVTSLVVQADGKVVAGTSLGLYRFGTTGASDPAFGSTASTKANVTALALQPDGRIIAVGFVPGATGNVVRFDTGGAYDPSFVRAVAATSSGNPGPMTAVLVQPDGKVVVGGRFTTTGSPQAYRVVRYETTGALDPTFGLNRFSAASGNIVGNTRIYSLARQADGKILVGGNFEALDGQPRYGVARLSATGLGDATFTTTTPLSGTVFAVLPQPNGRVLLGGSFTKTLANGSTNNLTRVLADGTEDSSFGPTTTPNATVRSLLIDPSGAIIIGGSFSSISGQPATGVARIAVGNVLAVAAPAAVAARTSAWPVPAHGLLHVAPDASAHPLALSLCDALGRMVRSQSIAGAAEQTLALDGLPAGVYLLRVSYAAGIVTRRIAVQ